MAILYSLGLLERKSAQNQPFNALEFVHLATEASRLANADRRNIVGDPAYSNVNSRVSVLLSPGYLNGRAAFIGSTGMGTVPVGGTARGIPPFMATDPAAFDPLSRLEAPLDDHDDQHALGAHIEAAGMLLNDALSNFSAGAVGSDVNGFQAIKRPRTSISPSIAFDGAGKLRLVWGSAGGGPIPDYIVKTFMGHFV